MELVEGDCMLGVEFSLYVGVELVEVVGYFKSIHIYNYCSSAEINTIIVPI